MWNKLILLFRKNREVVLYLIFGALTTVVNYVIYIPLHHGAGVFASVANVAAWIVAVMFAFITNKPFVFESTDWALKCVIPEFLKFIGARIGSLILETLLLLLTVDILELSGIIMKILTSILVVIINYFASKFIVFKKDS